MYAESFPIEHSVQYNVGCNKTFGDYKTGLQESLGDERPIWFSELDVVIRHKKDYYVIERRTWLGWIYKPRISLEAIHELMQENWDAYFIELNRKEEALTSIQRF